jgi:hypothetical protein
LGHVIVKGNPGDSVLVAHQCPYDVARDGGHNQDLAARGHKHAPGWARVHTHTHRRHGPTNPRWDACGSVKLGLKHATHGTKRDDGPWGVRTGAVRG